MTRRTGTAVFLVGLGLIIGLLVLSGQIGYAVTSGISMEPRYHTGDVVFLTKDSGYSVGDIVAYHNSNGSVVLHRIIAVDADGYTVKGDNNPVADSDHPTNALIKGRVAASSNVPTVALTVGGLVIAIAIVRRVRNR